MFKLLIALMLAQFTVTAALVLAEDHPAAVSLTASALNQKDWQLEVQLAPGIDRASLDWRLDEQPLKDSQLTVTEAGKATIQLSDLTDGAHVFRVVAKSSSADAVASPDLIRRAVDIGDFDWHRGIIYFVMTDRFYDGDSSNNINVDKNQKGFYHGGDLKGLTEKLDYIADLGVNALWITPIVDNIDSPVTGAGFPDWGYHGYWAENFDKIDEHLGSEDDMKALVAAAHARGIKVLLDVVVNHCGYGSHWATKSQWVRSSELGTCGQDDYTTCVSGLPDFRTEKADVADYLMNIQIQWAEKTGVDGFRLDTLKHVRHDFWQEFRKRLRAKFNKFFLVGEVWDADGKTLDSWFAGDEIDAGFDFSFANEVLPFISGRTRTVAFDHYLAKRHDLRAGYLVSQYLDSHDVDGFLFRAGGDKKKLSVAAVLEMSTFGVPMIYYGDEVGRAGGTWPANRSDMLWGGDQDQELLTLYRRLAFARRMHPSVSSGTHRALLTEQNLYAFARELPTANDCVVIAVNRGSEPATLDLELPELLAAKTELVEITAAHTTPVTDKHVKLELPAMTAVWLAGQ